MIEHIQNQFQQYKINQLQLDPFGVCNAKCWFCPVVLKGNPKEGREVMSPELLEKIIKNNMVNTILIYYCTSPVNNTEPDA